ncbi:unnamed protein product [Amoebophrya sp. A120]|nr:unnamed protein product [Amoebophrya sp. A120]|eukprot:GSA120T00011228001.1
MILMPCTSVNIVLAADKKYLSLSNSIRKKSPASERRRCPSMHARLYFFLGRVAHTGSGLSNFLLLLKTTSPSNVTPFSSTAELFFSSFLILLILRLCFIFSSCTSTGVQILDSPGFDFRFRLSRTKNQQNVNAVTSIFECTSKPEK